MARRVFLAWIFSAISIAVAAQMQRRLYQAGWQQRVDYKIRVALDTTQKIIRGDETISYTNNSPDTLYHIYLHLWPNAYKSNETPFAKQLLKNGKTDFYFSGDEDRGYIDSLNFIVDGQNSQWVLLEGDEVCKIVLNKPLPPSGQISITTPFKVKLPKVFSRMGYESGIYCLTQWYPKPAVYDVNGWNTMHYLDMGEFYSEYGNFDVSITVPANYVVAATGNLQNAEELEWLSVAARTDVFGKTEASTKTLRYTQTNVHDFAWFCSEQFRVFKSGVTLPHSGRKVDTWLFSAKPKVSQLYMIDSAVLYYSNMVGEYEYDQATVVVTPLKSGTGMEYPTITNVSKANRQVIFHEVGHNWFYGMIGSNERLYPWMDESINTYYETRSQNIIQPSLHEGIKLKKFREGKEKTELLLGETPRGFQEFLFHWSARINEDQPIGTPSEEFSSFNYATIVYAKGPLLVNHLQDYLGDSLFDSAVKQYFKVWKGKHPLPGDFIKTMENATGKHLSWFEKALLSNGQQDIRIKKINARKKQLTLYSTQNHAVPVSYTLYQHNLPATKYWIDSVKKTTRVNLPTDNFDKIILDEGENVIDLYRQNNVSRARGVFKKWRPIKLQLFANTENPYRQQLFLIPLYAYNIYDKSMLGAHLYNSLIPQKRTEFSITPLYSPNTNAVNGYLSIEHHIAAGEKLQQITFGFKAARFSYEYFANPHQYNKLTPYLKVIIRPKNKSYPYSHELLARSVFIYNNTYSETKPLLSNAQNYSVREIAYFYNSNMPVNQRTIKASIEQISDGFLLHKLKLELNQTITYNQKNKQFDIRLFAGSFIRNTNVKSNGIYDFRAGGINGVFDYTFDEALIARNATDGLFSKQMIDKEASFKIPRSIGNSGSWIASVHAQTTLPGPLPLRLYADVVSLNSRVNIVNSQSITDTAKWYYAAGLKVIIMKGVLEIYLPVFVSDNISNLYKQDPKNKDASSFDLFLQRASFVLNLQNLNPIAKARKTKF
jgi:hypothetical protein